MPVDKRTEVGQISYNSDGSIYVREDTILVDTDTGEELARNYHRRVVTPDQEDLSQEPPLVQSIAETQWDDEKKARWRDIKEAQRDGRPERAQRP